MRKRRAGACVRTLLQTWITFSRSCRRGCRVACSSICVWCVRACVCACHMIMYARTHLTGQTHVRTTPRPCSSKRLRMPRRMPMLSLASRLRTPLLHSCQSLTLTKKYVFPVLSMCARLRTTHNYDYSHPVLNPLLPPGWAHALTHQLTHAGVLRQDVGQGIQPHSDLRHRCVCQENHGSPCSRGSWGCCRGCRGGCRRGHGQCRRFFGPAIHDNVRYGLLAFAFTLMCIITRILALYASICMRVSIDTCTDVHAQMYASEYGR